LEKGEVLIPPAPWCELNVPRPIFDDGYLVERGWFSVSGGGEVEDCRRRRPFRRKCRGGLEFADWKSCSWGVWAGEGLALGLPRWNVLAVLEWKLSTSLF
jgi:hypothetical protein